MAPVMRITRTAENLVGGIAVLVFAAASPSQIPKVLISFAIWMCPSVGALGQLFSFKAGSMEIRLSGMINVAVFLGATVFIWQNRRVSWRVLCSNFRVFLLFVAFAGLRVLDSPNRGIGLKDVLLFSVPLAIGVVVEVAIARGLDPRWLEKQLLWSPLLTAGLLGAQALFGSASYNEYGLLSSFGKGPIALFALPIYCLALSRWRYDTNKMGARLATALALVSILVTVERMASVVALLVLLPLRFIKFNRRFISSALVSTALAVIVGFLLFQVPAVRYRFFEDKENLTLQQQETIINTTGRVEMWSVTLVDALERPFLGHGTGSSEVLIPEMVPGLDHPHEEYLRVYHDLGVIGLALFISAWFGRLFNHFRQWRSSDDNPDTAQPHMAAALASIAMTVLFLTDNALVATFVMVPVFVLLAIADRSRGSLSNDIIESS